MPLGKLRLGSRKSATTKTAANHAGSEAELMASRSTAHRLSSVSVDSGDDLSSTGSPTGPGAERHRSASGHLDYSPSTHHRYSTDDLTASESSGHRRRSSTHSGGSSGRSFSDYGSGRGSQGFDGFEQQGKRRTSIFGGGANGNEARVVRVFFRDETYRSVRFMEEESCLEVLDRLWPRLDMQGERLDYKFYIVYKKEGNRFVNDTESAEVLLGSDWMEVEKIYIRHKNDKVAAKRRIQRAGSSAEVVLKKSKSFRESVRGGVAPNPFANVTGDSHTVNVEGERPMSKFAQLFSQAWDNAELQEHGEERSDSVRSPPSSPLKFDVTGETISTTSVASHLRAMRCESSTDSGRGSLERKAEAPRGDDMDSVRSRNLTPQHRRSISSITADSGVSLHQGDLDSPVIRKALSRSSVGSGGSPRASTSATHYSHSSLSKLSFVPVDVNLGDAPTPPTAPKLSIVSPASHYSIPSSRSFPSDTPPPSPLLPPPPPPPAPECDSFDRKCKSPSPTPSLPPPPSDDELMRIDRLQFSFQVTIGLRSDGLHC